MGFKRSEASMRKIEDKLRQGMERNGITGAAADTITRSITSFALYGFPESHAASFALLAYASAYLKVHTIPPPFYTALLNNQPMGFYHPATLVKDAQHRKQSIKPIDVLESKWLCKIENDDSVRLGLIYVNGLRTEVGKAIEREQLRQPICSIVDLQRRSGLSKAELITLAEIGALKSFSMKLRQALWQVEWAGRRASPLFAPLERYPETTAPLTEMSADECLIADYRARE